MDLSEFQAFVSERAEYFEGVRPETADSLAIAERQLGCCLPETLKWLLSERGYSQSCGIESLDGAVTLTLQCREWFQLPKHYIVINDWGDGGVVYLDTRTGIIHWGDGADLHDLAHSEPPSQRDETYADYPAWVASRVEVAFIPRE